ncbi:exopolysaccharide biosynthesis polyprenyl glycosylphosphotransferase [uncultured Polaribacter sp.]|uniref:exopolysaccharide biosynthesis polyprenyl glycosylphosphotransferase n=1 Tax=uncultured Polaribacter sp. TaxID=174711 RepID=UPI00260B4547|nr:exopolysaccharide biosynthesis polyprenyl glycosylphosphotransferase [uncultured Polaribacter sp.]
MKKRYSFLIKPLQILLDILLIILIIFFIRDKAYLNLPFLLFIILFWLLTSYSTSFYRIYRHFSALKILTLIVKQFLIFTLGYFAYFGVFKEGEVVNNQFLILVTILISITFTKFIIFFLVKKYRALGNNFRTTVVLGYDDSAKKVIKIFNSKANLGYKFLGFFSEREFKNHNYLGKIKEVFEFVENNIVDELYCSLSVLTKNQIKEIKKYTTDKGIVLKLIPNANELYSKNQSIEFYDDTLLVLNVKKLPFEFAENFYIKRMFDVFFSLLVAVFLLSWLLPILWVLVKIESKGPLIFRQKREGINGDEFVCYKFRSMQVNEHSDTIHAIKGDVRVTTIGAFMRRTSIDELPQFINVLFGDMSVVGPRPHLESLSLEYQRDVDDYLKRHIVKPGITGLAQISGYRGEIKNRSDIKNRVRLDIFYIENWSFLLDLKIIIQTILNVFKGEKNAY